MKWVEGSGPTDKIRANSEDMTLTFNWLLKCEFFNWLGQLIFLQASFVMAEVCRVALLGDRSVATLRNTRDEVGQVSTRKRIDFDFVSICI